MKQYLLAVHSVEGAPAMSHDEIQTVFAETGRINDALQASGTWVFGGGLLPPKTTTNKNTKNNTTSMTDGPFAETREHLAGFWVIKCADLDEALAWAAKCAAACGPIEVRPFDELSQA